MAKKLNLKEQILEWENDLNGKYKDWEVVISKSFTNKNSFEKIKCTKCNQYHNEENFKIYRTIDNKRKKLYYGRKRFCSKCTNLYIRKWRYNDPEKVEKLLLESHCQICKDKFKDDRNKFIDHCHNTNKIRGVLCTKCNTLLGMIERKKEIFINIKKYLI